MKRVVKAERSRVGEALRRRDHDTHGNLRDRFRFILTLDCGHETRKWVLADKGGVPPFPRRVKCRQCEVDMHRYRCTACDVVLTNYDEFEEYQHAGPCGGLVVRERVPNLTRLAGKPPKT